MVQCPGLLGSSYRRVEGTRFETVPAGGPANASRRLLVYDGDECVAVFLPAYWQAAWYTTPDNSGRPPGAPIPGAVRLTSWC